MPRRRLEPDEARRRIKAEVRKALHGRGLQHADLAAQLAVSVSLVRQWMSRRGPGPCLLRLLQMQAEDLITFELELNIPPRYRVPPTAATSLSEVQAFVRRAAAAHDLSYLGLAELLGVSHSSVRQWLTSGRGLCLARVLQMQAAGLFQIHIHAVPSGDREQTEPARLRCAGT